MSGPVMADPFSTVTTTSSVSFACLTGFVQRRPPVTIFQRGTHLLLDVNGNVIATLRSNQVNLASFEGRFVTVCGINEGQIEGVTSLLVTQVLSANVPGTTPFPGQVDLRLLLLLLLLTNPNLLSTNPQLLQILLLSGILGGVAGTSLGTALSSSLAAGTSISI